MNRRLITWLPMVIAASTVIAAPIEAMTLQEEREQIGRNMEEGRRQSGQELNAIREGATSDGADSSIAEQPSAASGAPATGPHRSTRNGDQRPVEQAQDDNQSSAAGNGSRRSIIGSQHPNAGQSSGGIDANGNASSPDGTATGGNGTPSGNGSGIGGKRTGGTVSGGAVAAGGR